MHVYIFDTLSFSVYDAREDGTTIEEYQDKGAGCHGMWKTCQSAIYA